MELTVDRIEVSGVSVDVTSAGAGPPLLYLHGGFGLSGHASFLATLAKHFRVVAPGLPGFEHSELPREYNCVGDLAYFCLDLADQLGLRGATLAGACFGGWVTAEMTVRSTAGFKCLILIDALGVKFGDHLTRDITDIHAMSEADLEAALYAQPESYRRDTTVLTDDELTAIVRNREAFALFGWKPYMHNAGLARWLHRIDIPTLVLWGDRDGMVSGDYGRKYAAAIPNARFEIIENAGHYPGIEQAGVTAHRLVAFAADS